MLIFHIYDMHIRCSTFSFLETKAKFQGKLNRRNEPCLSARVMGQIPLCSLFPLDDSIPWKARLANSLVCSGPKKIPQFHCTGLFADTSHECNLVNIARALVRSIDQLVVGQTSWRNWPSSLRNLVSKRRFRRFLRAYNLTG